MPALKLLLALASVAIVALSSAPVHVNALVADHAQVARDVRGHDAVAKRKRGDSSSTSACIPKPSSSLPPTSTPAPTSTTPTSSAPPVSTSAASSSSGKQWGLAWGADPADLPNFARPNVGYLYNWDSSFSSPLPEGIEYIPMLWGPTYADAFQQTVVQGYANIVLGMNEPNEPSQSNLTPQQGVDLWMQYILPLKALGYYLISPACTDDDAGLTWYEQFFSICAGNCQVDAIAFHAYTTNAADLINYANQLHSTYNMDVWITEFADQNYSGTGSQATMSEVWDFAGQVVDFVNSNTWCKAFPFGIMTDLKGVNTDNSLLGSDGYPTSLGYTYFG